MCVTCIVFNHRAILAEWFKGKDSKNEALVFGKLIHAERVCMHHSSLSFRFYTQLSCTCDFAITATLLLSCIHFQSTCLSVSYWKLIRNFTLTVGYGLGMVKYEAFDQLYFMHQAVRVCHTDHNDL